FVENMLISSKNLAKNIKFSITPTDFTKAADIILKHRLFIGCTATCPFCGSMCDQGVEQHELHSTKDHRPIGARRNSADTKLMELEMCPKKVSSADEFKADNAAESSIFYSDYQRTYPDWLISADNDADPSKYWQWFFANFGKLLAEAY